VATEGNRTAEPAVREGRALGAESARAPVPGATAPHGNRTVCGTAQLRRSSDAVFLIFLRDRHSLRNRRTHVKATLSIYVYIMKFLRAFISFMTYGKKL
jgi:hypothetical protein